MAGALYVRCPSYAQAWGSQRSAPQNKGGADRQAPLSLGLGFNGLLGGSLDLVSLLADGVMALITGVLGKSRLA